MPYSEDQSARRPRPSLADADSLIVSAGPPRCAGAWRRTLPHRRTTVSAQGASGSPRRAPISSRPSRQPERRTRSSAASARDGGGGGPAALRTRSGVAAPAARVGPCRPRRRSRGRPVRSARGRGGPWRRRRRARAPPSGPSRGHRNADSAATYLRRSSRRCCNPVRMANSRYNQSVVTAAAKGIIEAALKLDPSRARAESRNELLESLEVSSEGELSPGWETRDPAAIAEDREQARPAFVERRQGLRQGRGHPAWRAVGRRIGSSKRPRLTSSQESVSTPSATAPLLAALTSLIRRTVDPNHRQSRALAE